VNATVKYTLARIGLFLAVFVVLLPVPMNILLKLMIAVLVSAGLAYLLLRGWRDEMATSLAAAAERRKVEKERLRAALAGDDRPAGTEGPASADEPANADGPASADEPANADRPASADDRAGPQA